MNKLKILWTVVLAIMLVLPQIVLAQKSKGKPKTKPKTKTAAARPKPKAVVEPDFTRVSMVWDSAGYCPLSMRAVHKSDIMYKMQLTRQLDLRQKCNQPWFARDKEFTKFLIEGVKNGKLNAYMADDDSLNKLMSKKKFDQLIIDPSTVADKDAAPQLDMFGKPIKSTGAGAQAFMGNQLFLIEIYEDLIFDKQRSRMYYDIQYIKLIIPAELLPLKGVNQNVAYFKYKDVAKYMNAIPTAKWYNVSNRAEDKRFSDAFDLRLFCSTILKMSNPMGKAVADEPSNQGSEKRTLIAAQKYEYDLVNKETELWDY